MVEVDTSKLQFLEELSELRRSLVRCGNDPALLGLDSIVKAVPDLIYRLDADGRILFTVSRLQGRSFCVLFARPPLLYRRTYT